MEKQKEELDKKKTDFERLKTEHDRLDEDTQREKDRLKKVINSISEFLHKELTGKDDAAVTLSIEIKNFDSRLKEIEDAIKSKRSTIDAISEKTNIMSCSIGCKMISYGTNHSLCREHICF